MPSYGQFTGYEPGPAPGTYGFTGPNGQKWVFGGPQAEELKARLDAANSFQPKFAQNMTPAEEPNMTPMNASDVQGQMGPTTEAAATPEAPAAPQKPASPLDGFQPSHTNAQGDTVMVNPATGQVLVNARARAGSKGGLVERSRTVQGGFKPDEEYVDATRANFEQTAVAQAMGVEAANKQAEAERALLQQEQRNLADQQAEQQAQTDQIAAGVTDLQQKYNTAEKDFDWRALRPIDANDGRNVMADSIISGLGVVGALMNKSPNYTQQILEQEFQKNIRRQEAEFQVLGDRRDNILSKLKQQLGSLDLAKSALHGMQIKRAQNQFAQIAATTGDLNRQAVALENAAKLDQQWQDWNQDYLRRSEGQVSRSLVNTPGSAGSRGGVRLATQQELQGARGIQGQEADITSTNTNTAKTKAELEAGPGGAADSPDKQKRVSSLKSALALVDDLDAKHAKANRPGIYRESGVGTSDTSKSLSSDINALVPIVDAAKQGGAPNDSTMAALKESLISGDGEKIQQSIAAERAALIAKLRAEGVTVE